MARVSRAHTAQQTSRRLPARAAVTSHRSTTPFIHSQRESPAQRLSLTGTSDMPANRCRGRPMMLANMRENGVRLFVVVFPNDLAGRWVHKVDAPAHDAGDRLIGVLAIRPRRIRSGPVSTATGRNGIQ